MGIIAEFELTFNTRCAPDPEHPGLMKLETTSWDITRNGERPSSAEEADAWRLAAFGEWR